MKTTLKAVIHIHAGANSNNPHFAIFGHDMSDYGYIKVCETQIEVELPADFNPTAAQIAALEAQKDKAHDEFQQRLTQLNEQISKLQAIEHVPAAPQTIQEGAAA